MAAALYPGPNNSTVWSLPFVVAAADVVVVAAAAAAEGLRPSPSPWGQAQSKACCYNPYYL